VRLHLIALPIALVLASACAQHPDSALPTAGSLTIEPQAGLDSGHGCDLQLGVARVNALFYAINQQEAVAVAQLFPDSGQWEFEIAPSINRSLQAGHLLADDQSDRATAPDQIPAVVSSLSGLHFVFTAPLSGREGLVEHLSPQGTVRINEVDLGPVMWKATGTALQAHAKQWMTGGGKIGLSCDTGRFMKVTLGAISVG